LVQGQQKTVVILPPSKETFNVLGVELPQEAAFPVGVAMIIIALIIIKKKIS